MQQPQRTTQKDISNSVLNPVLSSAFGERVRWRRLLGSARGLAIAGAARQHEGPVLVIARDVRVARQLEDEIRFYCDDPTFPVMAFPDWESLPYDLFSPHQDIVSQRLATLYQLPGLRRGLVLSSISTLLHRLPPREYVSGHSLVLAVGTQIDLDVFRRELARSAYHHVSQVIEPGEFAVRGGLIDLFPVGSHTPYRIDLFGDEIESIREFNPDTQRSGRKLDSVRLLPAREYPLTEPAIQRFRQAFRARFAGDPQQVPVYRDVSKGFAPPGTEYYLPLFFDQTATVFDYLPESALCILDEGVEQSAREFSREIESRYAELGHDRERPLLAPHELFVTLDQMDAACARRSCIELADLDTTPGGLTVTYATKGPPALTVDHKSDNPYGELLQYLRNDAGRTLIVVETLGRKETLRALLQDNGLVAQDVSGWKTFLGSPTKLGLAVANLEKGLVLPDPPLAVITEPQLYGERAVQRRRRVRHERDPEAIIRSLAELRVGDPVVHEDHGVGRYLGLQTLDVGDGATEFIALEYADGDKLYVPVLSLHLISRYTGTDPEHAPLHKLGGDQWEKAKRRAMQKAHDAAVELLEINALRASRQGHAFPAHDEHYQAFADAFPFEETPDQLRAITDVVQDMESTKPMDRLVCGDVGFGKTEVAMRAAFLAAHGQHQVALLVPTTLLAQQHYQNFVDRFAGLPYRIELLSRFRSKGDQTAVLEGLEKGTVDIVIGTHRLLQSDVRFRRLGLLIIDEEHRFGVRQKERLKQLRSEVDILTLTATPIPRTLNIALAGLRDISIIATAPEGRLSVKTLVSEWNKGLVREAILREIRRGGQVYYLHNEVRTIDRAARQLQESVPEADVRIAHGQMPERELEHIMLDFYHRRLNVLVCSTIIESGIDVPTANTIIVARADKLGLAQLHQLRGRVGRSHTRAYAYLLIPGRDLITEDARKRLEAIESLEELGAGFTLASHDLEIRGAGELLGEAQSGEIDEVGFALYSELLDRAVKSLQTGVPLGDMAMRSAGADINLHVPALLPETYIPDIHMRLILYKRIANAENLATLQELREEVIDRFGLLPEPGRLLFQATALKIRATPLGIRKIEVGAKGARIDFVARPDIDPGRIIQLIQSAPRVYRLDGPTRLRITQELPDAVSRTRSIETLLDGLSGAKERIQAMG